MTFLSPWMLAGAAAVSIPIALHFFYRARYKPLPWAPMKFLKEAIEQTSRRLKFQEWILLALRCLAIILLALALARPGFKSATVAGRGEAIDAVFVFDTSYSMAARDGDKTRLERAKDAALAVLDTLPTNSSVQIYGCSDRATFLGPVQRFNIDQARQLIPTIEVASLSTDLFPGLAEALNAAKNGTAPAKEIYVFTDMQKSGFERQQGAIKSKCEEIKAQANLVFVRCGKPDKRVPNVAVVDVKLISDIPHTRTRVPFEVTLKNTGSEPVKAVKVALELDGKAIEKDAVQIDQIDSGMLHTVMLTASLDEPGLRVIAVEITGDELPGDNVLYKTVLVRDKVRVLLVDGTPNPDNPTDAGDHFVKTALNPGRVPDYYIESDSVSAAEASPLHLDNRDIVYLLNAPVREANPTVGMSAEFLAKLDEFVRGGGGLVIGCGDLVNADAYNRVLGADGYKLLPFDFTVIRTASEQTPYNPAPETVEEASFVGPFRQPPYSDALRLVAVNRMLDLNDSATAGRVLIKSTEGRPFLASRVAGEGEVIVTTTSLDERWGKFPSEARAFVPFTRYLLNHLTGRKVPGGTSMAGSPLVWLPPEGAKTEYELVKPAKPGEKFRQRVRLEASEARDGQKAAVTATDTARAGLYHIVPLGKADDAGPLFAVNPDLRESADLTVATDTDVENWLGFRPPIIPAGAGTESAVSQLRTRTEWTVYVLLALLILLVVEGVWAWSCGRAW
jgi:Aerotolerance regulator N-terminal/von Willebrand factor type A domain